MGARANRAEELFPATLDELRLKNMQPMLLEFL